MDIKILPNWCKRFGFILFIVFAIIGMTDGSIDEFNKGYYEADNKGKPVDKGDCYEYADGTSFQKSSVFNKYFSPRALELFSALTGIALLLVLLAKGKIEDEYIRQLRLESFQLTTLIGLILCVLFLLFDFNIQTLLVDIIYLYVILYLLIFNVKSITIKD